MLSGLIPGPKQPGNDIDTYLRPLVDDLKTLWSKGAEVWDENKREYFDLRALLFVTISDSPATCNLSGQSKKLGCGCPHCLDGKDCRYLNKSRKMVYMGHRRYLPLKHPLRKMKHLFDGTIEKRPPPQHKSGKEVYDQVKHINVVLGKRKRSPPNDENGVWHKKSILWELPYWSELDVRHSIDVMHVEKNVCDSLLGTFLNMPGKSKDHENARADLKEISIRPELHPVEMDTELPTTCITLSKKEKKEFCEFLKSVKVPPAIRPMSQG